MENINFCCKQAVTTITGDFQKTFKMPSKFMFHVLEGPCKHTPL